MTIFEAEKYIQASVKALLSQTISDFEIIIVEDPPYDGSEAIIKSLNDPRIKYYRNEKRLGLAASRNACIRHSSGDILFFTDDDCIASNDWLEQALTTFDTIGCEGVEGRTIYVSEEYTPAFSEDVVSYDGGIYATCNIAYKRSLFKAIGEFNPEFKRGEDTDYAFRALNAGNRISYNPNMKVYHQVKPQTTSDYVNSPKWVEWYLLLIQKRYKKIGGTYFFWRIAFPTKLLMLLLPALIIGYPLRSPGRFKSKKDWDKLPYTWLRALKLRVTIWRFSLRERTLFI
jgi:GT2 family glycosyltransferase